MKAIRIHGFGAPDAMQYEDVPDPVAGKGQVVVSMRAVGINPVETYIRAGTYPNKPQLPYTPGSDAAGIVESVGEEVESFKIGDRVYTAGAVAGTYAEKILCDESQVYALPGRVSFAQGAAIHVPYATAYRALMQRAQGREGETVLVHGASGGVGIASVQIALAHKMTVIGTAGTIEGLKLLEKQGLKYVLNHHEAGYVSDALGATCGRGIDIVLEMLANVNLGVDLTILRQNGRVVIIGSRGEATIDPRQAMSRDAAILGMTLFNVAPDEMRAIHEYIGCGLDDGTLNPVIGREFALQDAPRAHEAIGEPGALGKIVLVP